MKITKIIGTLLATGLLLATITAQAIPGSINGAISFTGGSTVNTGDLSTATSFTSFSSLSVLAGAETGDYLPLNGGGNFSGSLSFSTFGFGGNVLSPATVVPLWTVTSGGVTYSFDATSVQIKTQTSSFLNLTGNGIAHITGFADTVGTWSITDTTQGGPIFTFGASTTVPDGGTTAMLLGSVLALFGVARRYLKA